MEDFKFKDTYQSASQWKHYATLDGADDSDTEAILLAASFTQHTTY